jgi:hypothetical protein
MDDRNRLPEQRTGRKGHEANMLNKKVIDRLQWEFYVPIFRNRYILKGLALAVGLPFGIVIALIIITAKGDIFGTDAKYALGLIVLLFLLTFLLIMIIYGGKYAPRLHRGRNRDYQLYAGQTGKVQPCHQWLVDCFGRNIR